MALLLWTPFGRLPPGYLTTFFFFFFFFFFLAFFFFFFFFFLAFFFGFFAFFFAGFFVAFFAFFFLADVCCVRARAVALVISFFTCGGRNSMRGGKNTVTI